MKVLQLIDSLHAGGAERVAVNFANALASKTDGSYICATREEGVLKNNIHKNVGYFFLNKSRTLDIFAIIKLNRFVKKNDINIIHAHSSSFFLATIIRFLNKKLKIVWHDHYGNSEFLDERKSTILRFCSKYFSQVFCVNEDLKSWAIRNLRVDEIDYLPNYAVLDQGEPKTQLHGIEGKRIVCLANFRSQKNHFMLVDVFKKILVKNPNWSLHCVGKDFKDKYTRMLNEKIVTLGLSKNVYLYDSVSDVSNILNQCQIGVLSSNSEGLPLALLEYGLAELPVVTTDVGDCRKVVQHNITGVLVEKNNSEKFYKSLDRLVSNPILRKRYAKNLNVFVNKFWSEEVILSKLYNYYKKLSVHK